MTEFPFRKDDAPTIGILRALFLGDFICATPFLRSLRLAFPRARLSWIGLPWMRPLISRFGIESFIEFPGFPGIPEVAFSPQRTTAFIERCQRERFDLLIQIHGRGEHVNELVTLCDPRTAAGFYNAGQWCPDPRHFLPYQEHQHEILRLAELGRHLGLPETRLQPEFPFTIAEELEAHALLDAGAIRGDYVCIHPGAKTAGTWPAASFAGIADHLMAKGFSIVLTGTSEEHQLVSSVQAHMAGAAYNLCGATALGTLAALLKNASALVCHDTGVSHLAGATGTPSIIIFEKKAGSPWPPLNQALHRFLHAPNGLSVDAALEALIPILRKGVRISPASTTSAKGFHLPCLEGIHRQDSGDPPQ